MQANKVMFEQVKFSALRGEIETLLNELDSEQVRLASEFDPGGYQSYQVKCEYLDRLLAEIRGCQFADGSTIGAEA